VPADGDSTSEGSFADIGPRETSLEIDHEDTVERVREAFIDAWQEAPDGAGSGVAEAFETPNASEVAATGAPVPAADRSPHTSGSFTVRNAPTAAKQNLVHVVLGLLATGSVPAGGGPAHRAGVHPPAAT
jgi:hypothetical protein